MSGVLRRPAVVPVFCHVTDLFYGDGVLAVAVHRRADHAVGSLSNDL